MPQAAFDLIVALRGGLPEACDCCGQPFTQERYPVPEEAGEWTCSECEKLWRCIRCNLDLLFVVNRPCPRCGCWWLTLDVVTKHVGGPDWPAKAQLDE